MDYETLMNLADKCMTIAVNFAQALEWDLAIFYKNASNCYKERAMNLIIPCS